MSEARQTELLEAMIVLLGEIKGVLDDIFDQGVV